MPYFRRGDCLRIGGERVVVEKFIAGGAQADVYQVLNVDRKENMAMKAENREQKSSMATCKEALADYKRIYLPVPSIEDRKPVFLSKETRDRLDRIVRLFGERKMSVSGITENIVRRHLEVYEKEIDEWRKL